MTTEDAYELLDIIENDSTLQERFMRVMAGLPSIPKVLNLESQDTYSVIGKGVIKVCYVDKDDIKHLTSGQAVIIDDKRETISFIEQSRNSPLVGIVLRGPRPL